jgi:hypothetical protein
MASYIDEMLDSALSQREKMEFPLILVIEEGNAKRSEKIAALFSEQYASFYTHTNGEDMDIALQMTAIPQDVEVAVIGLTNPSASNIKNTCQILRPSHGICLLDESISMDLLKALRPIKSVMFIDNDHKNVLSESEHYSKKIGSVTILAALHFKGKTPCTKVCKISHIESKSFDRSEDIIITFSDGI